MNADAIKKRLEELAREAEAHGARHGQTPGHGFMYGYADGLRRAAEEVAKG